MNKCPVCGGNVVFTNVRDSASEVIFVGDCPACNGYGVISENRLEGLKDAAEILKLEWACFRLYSRGCLSADQLAGATKFIDDLKAKRFEVAG